MYTRQEVNDSELNFCFRKLAKKDTTTKVKALDELAALFALRTADELALVLPAWVRLSDLLTCMFGYVSRPFSSTCSRRLHNSFFWSLGMS